MRLRGTITLLGTVTHTQLRATQRPTRLTAGWAIALFCVLCVLRCLLPEGEGTGGNSCDSSPFPVFACRPPFFSKGGGRRYGPRGSQPIRSETPTDRPVAQMPASHSATDFDRFYFFVFFMIVVVLFFLLLALHRRNPEEVSASLERRNYFPTTWRKGNTCENVGNVDPWCYFKGPLPFLLSAISPCFKAMIVPSWVGLHATWERSSPRSVTASRPNILSLSGRCTWLAADRRPWDGWECTTSRVDDGTQEKQQGERKKRTNGGLIFHHSLCLLLMIPAETTNI